MHQWLNARCAKLLEELNQIPFTDEVDDLKLNLIRAAMREASIEMFQRAAENSRKAIEKINKEALSEAITEVEASLIEDVNEEKIAEPAKISLPENLVTPAAKDDTPKITLPENMVNPNTDTAVAKPAAESANAKSDSSGEAKARPKIQISSSVIRRSD